MLGRGTCVAYVFIAYDDVTLVAFMLYAEITSGEVIF